MISMSVSGIEGLKEAINRKEKALLDGVDTIMAEEISNINKEQKIRAPYDAGFLRASLDMQKIAPLNYKLVSTGQGSEYAPYQEFGTGGLVSIPPGLEKEAALYRGKGQRKVNMKAQPFFFAPAIEGKQRIIKRIVQLLNK
jgi:HK97 gp10 family phage protein